MESKQQQLEEIVEYAKMYGLSQYQIAKGTGIAESTISRIFNGKTVPSNSTLSVLRSYLQIRYPGASFDSSDMNTLRDKVASLTEENAKLRQDLEMRDQIIKMMLSKNAPA